MNKFKKMKNILLIVATLTGLMANAQILEDKTEVAASPHGESTFTLDSGQQVYSYAPKEGWYKIRKEVYVAPANVVDEVLIRQGADLLNKDGELIGSALTDIKVEEGIMERGFRGKSNFRAIVEGYVFKTKFAENSHPEERISKLLAIKNRTEQITGFEEIFERYDFEEREFEELTAHVYREENKTLAEEKDFRVIVIFRSGNTPYAVITNGHTVEAPKVKTKWGSQPFEIIYFTKPTDAQKELVQDKILYTFRAL